VRIELMRFKNFWWLFNRKNRHHDEHIFNKKFFLKQQHNPIMMHLIIYL
jgi:hypothetical protein